MSNRKNKACGGQQFIFWQSAAANSFRYATFLDQIMNIALARFEWNGLPETCDERYIENQLLKNGMVSIAADPYGHIYSLQVNGNGPINMYDYPSRWRALGSNGVTYEANWDRGAIVYDNINRTPILSGIEMYAYELADLMALKTTNRQQQKAPFILTGPVSKLNDMTNLYKQIAGNEPAVLANPDISQIQIQAFQTGVSYIADKIDEDIENTWRKIYGLLGVNNAPYKAERQLESEIIEHSEPAEISRLSPLTCRRKAADWINKVLGTSISVNWRRDWDGKAQMGALDAITGDDSYDSAL